MMTPSRLSRGQVARQLVCRLLAKFSIYVQHIYRQQKFVAMSFCSFSGGEIFKDHFDAGVYVCVKCEYELFSSKCKYEHSSPWPAFTETVHEDSVSKEQEKNRPNAYKIRCGKCGNGLGHEFVNDGPKPGLSRF